jgi:ELWxxDGT repeat protein
VGTSLVKAINPGTASANPSGLTNVGGTLYFSASDATHGIELWQSDGTGAGTSLVKDINPGSDSGCGYCVDPLHLTEVAGTLYFTGYEATHGLELWKSDGTAAGTTMVKDIDTGSAWSDLSYLTNVGGTLYFSALDATHGFEVWKSDGTPVRVCQLGALRAHERRRDSLLLRPRCNPRS